MRFKQYFKESQVSYSSVVIDDESRAKLLNDPQVTGLITPDMEIIAHHMTIKMGGLSGTPHQERLGKAEQFYATDVGTALEGNVVAVKVSGLSDNKNPHITIAINRSSGAKPKDSNLITNWQPLETSILIKGVVLED